MAVLLDSDSRIQQHSIRIEGCRGPRSTLVSSGTGADDLSFRRCADLWNVIGFPTMTSWRIEPGRARRERGVP